MIYEKVRKRKIKFGCFKLTLSKFAYVNDFNLINPYRWGPIPHLNILGGGYFTPSPLSRHLLQIKK